MYKFKIYRCKAGEEVNITDRPISELTCTYEAAGVLVKHLDAKHPNYKHYFERASGFISRLDYCKGEIKRAFEQPKEYCAALARNCTK